MTAVCATAVGAFALAQDQQPGGRIVRIGKEDAGQTAPALPAPNNDLGRNQQQVAPAFWIGLAGGPLTPELRAHIDLPENQGVLVREIVPNSPAAKSGLKQYDIVLKANETQLHEMTDLVALVGTAGEKGDQIALDVLRKGKHETINVKPETRPANVALSTPNGFGQGEMPQGDGGQMQQMFGQMPELRRMLEGMGNNGQMEFRQFGPGVIVGGNDGGAANVPNGVSISIQRENNQPAKATVKRGNQTWEAIEGDEESLDNLPADLRPSVERMLNGNRGNRLQMNMGDFPQPGMNMRGMGAMDQTIQQRLEAIERQLKQLSERPNAEQGR